MDIFLHPYSIIGYIVAIFNLKKLAKSLENSSTGFMSGHPISVLRMGSNLDYSFLALLFAAGDFQRYAHIPK